MRASISRIGMAAVLGAGLLNAHVGAQVRDTLQVGDRVRVRVVATRGATNLFVGNLASVSPDTLVIDIPGGKGTIILPRAAVAEVAISNGDESRLRRLPEALPVITPGLWIVTRSAPPGPHQNGFRNMQYAFAALSAASIVSAITRRPREKWEPVYSWLEGR